MDLIARYLVTLLTRPLPRPFFTVKRRKNGSWIPSLLLYITAKLRVSSPFIANAKSFNITRSSIRCVWKISSPSLTTWRAMNVNTLGITYVTDDCKKLLTCFENFVLNIYEFTFCCSKSRGLISSIWLPHALTLQVYPDWRLVERAGLTEVDASNS